MRILITVISLTLSVTLSFAQDTSTRVYTLEEFLANVSRYHPMAKQANLLPQFGESKVREAKGSFDPKLAAGLDQKTFDNKDYYDILESGLKIPTWYGLELRSGFDQSSGQFLNPENDLPTGGLWYAGASITLGQGLIIDQRRASLKQAKIYQESTEAERLVALNDLYFGAITEYWAWVKAWNKYIIYEEALELAQERFEGVRQSYILGDLPAIDTLEAFLQVQNREMGRNENLLFYLNETLKLSNYLWFENGIPLEIGNNLRPPAYADVVQSTPIALDSFNSLLTTISFSHPEIRMYDYKLEGLEITRKLKQEMLKPQVNLNYNLLNEQIGSSFGSALSDQNYKWGFELGFPVFLRKERGQLQKSKLDIQTTALTRDQKILQLQNKLRKQQNEVLNLNQQINLYTSAVQNYNSLLQGERSKFTAGESSLFLVNSRERMYILSRLKLAEFITDAQKADAGIAWAAGLLAGQYP